MNKKKKNKKIYSYSILQKNKTYDHYNNHWLVDLSIFKSSFTGKMEHKLLFS